MSAKSFKLSLADVERLIQNPSADTRAETVAKVADAFHDGLNGGERAIAEEIFRAMVRDAEVRVRRALSESLKAIPDVPRDVALKLAEDVAEVANPILEHSVVLTDEDLIRIVERTSSEHHLSIARRKAISADLADALVDTEDEAVVAALVGNDGAELRESTLQDVLQSFGHSERVNEPMALRRQLPISVAERLVTLVSDRLREHLVTHHDLPPGTVTDLILESREKATFGLLGEKADRMDVNELVAQLADNGRLTPSIILRGICMGDIGFFEAATARLCGIPRVNAFKLIHDRGRRGLKALCDRAGIPEEMYPSVRIAVEVAQETDYDGGSGDRERFVERMIQRVLTAYEDGLDDENVTYLLGKLGVRSHAA